MHKGGFIRTLILIIIILIVLGYFGINIREVMQSETVKANISYVVDLGKTIWFRFLEKPTEYLWNNLFKQALFEGASNFKSGVVNPIFKEGGIGIPTVDFPQASQPGSTGY